MRKKTIEEELNEIAHEKEDHIEKLHKDFLSRKDNHAYDFDNCGIKENSSLATDDEEEFTKADRERLDKFHNGELNLEDDELWDEYMRLCGKYNKALDNGTLYKSRSSYQSTTRSTKKTMSAKENVLSIFSLSIMVAVGLCVMLFAGIFPLVKQNKINFVDVQSTVTSIGVSHDNGKTYATLGVDFKFNDKSYHTFVKIDVTNRPVPVIGEKINIQINPNDPQGLKKVNSANFLPPTIIGALFMGVGLIIQILLIVQVVKQKKQGSTND